MNLVDLGVLAFWLCLGGGVITGAFSLWVFRRYSDVAKTRAASNRIIAHLFEFRLFADEPLLIFRAQRDLLAANARLLFQVTRPTLVLILPCAIVLIAMNAVFGRAPVQIGRPAVITIQSDKIHSGTMNLYAPAGIRVETPPLRAEYTAQVSWRLRPTKPVTGDLQIHVANCVIKKSISSGPGLQWLSYIRTGSFFRFLVDPFESPFFCSAVRSIAIDYPRATIFGFNWAVWFSIGSFVGVLVLLLRHHEP